MYLFANYGQCFLPSRQAKDRGPDLLACAGVVGIAGGVLMGCQGRQPKHQTCSPGTKWLLEFKSFQHNLEPHLLML